MTSPRSNVAASASEWSSVHSLVLAATRTNSLQRPHAAFAAMTGLAGWYSRTGWQRSS